MMPLRPFTLLGLVWLSVIALTIPTALGQELVSYPSSMSYTDFLADDTAITGTLESGGAPELPDVTFTLKALNPDLSTVPFLHATDCAVEFPVVDFFTPDEAFTVYSAVDENPPACVFFGLQTTIGTQQSTINLDLSPPVPGLFLFVKPLVQSGVSGGLHDDVLFNSDFEILNDGCLYDDSPLCKPLERVSAGRLRRYDTSRGTIRFVGSVENLTIKRATNCRDRFEFTFGYPRRVDCKHGQWCDWSPCDSQCGPGKQVRSRATSGPWNGGDACGAKVEYKDCENAPCPVDCEVSDWSEWSDCSKECGSGKRTRTRTIVTNPVGTGAQCPNLIEEDECNCQECPQDCVLSPYTEWSQCTAQCGGGTQNRTRTIVTPPSGGGDDCDQLIESRECNTDECPVDCVQSEWTDWSSCSSTCGEGIQTRTRTTTTYPQNGGQECGPCEETKPCKTCECEVDCDVTDWSDWSTCSATCGGGSRKRTRTVNQTAANGGDACPPLEETEPCNTDPCSVDCELGPWTEWTTCSATCGGGTQTRTRPVLTPADCGGKPCEATSEERLCNSQNCPTDCEVSDFGDWSTCSKNCGGGSRKRTRTITKSPANGGESCPPLEESEPCNTQTCPVDCKLGEWCAWSTCSKQCGGGTQTRSRPILIQPSNGGQSCDNTEEVQPCNTKQCDVDCKVSDWSSWSTCDKPCGGGVQTRTRTILTQPSGNGNVCPSLTETKACNTQGCAVDCMMGPWGGWGQCSKTCGGGTRSRSRSVIIKSMFSGKPCPCSTETEPCNTQPCPIDCVMSEWSSFSQCSKSCGGGTQTRTRYAITNPQFGGKACPNPTETRDCNTQKCSQDCAGTWSEWSTCSATCGGGVQKRTFTVTQPQIGGGKCCPNSVETRPCNTQKCVRQCEVGSWSSWSMCTKKCGGGLKFRYRWITKFPQCGAGPCPPLIDSEPCNTEPCSKDCVVSPWSPWSSCSKTCGTGTQTRTRSIISQPTNGGKACPNLSETQTCNTKACPPPPVDCKQSEWSQWSSCSKTCGGGTQKRTRTIINQPSNGGCGCGVSEETRACNTDRCSVDCVLGPWCGWSTCSKKCGGGVQTRSRGIITFPGFGGKACDSLFETQPCNTESCPVDCVMGAWSSWSSCSKTCGSGVQTRTRLPVVQPSNGGKACPASTETRTCNVKSCPVDCKQSDWSDWSSCTKTCGGGTQYRTRKTLSRPWNGGCSCGPEKETRTCNTRSCSQDCTVGSWGSWSTCSKTCGGGVQTRTRKMTQCALNGGKACPPLSESQPCNTQPCAVKVDCKVSTWGSWSTCSKSCGGGTMTRTRTILSLPCNGGANCPPLSETVACNTHACPVPKVDCKVSNWCSWSSCSKTCGGGSKTRSRSIITYPSGGGAACPALTESATCNTQPCQTECKVSDWGAWSSCSKSCGGGIKTHYRSVITAPCNGGASCPPLSESVPCNTQACPTPVNCKVSDWCSWSSCSKTCGGGVKTQTRHILTQPSNGGAACPALTQTVPCNTQSCPAPRVECKVSDWSAWSKCSKTCGGGVKTQTRWIITQPSGGAPPCPALSQTIACNTQKCC